MINKYPPFCDYISVRQEHDAHEPFHGSVSRNTDSLTGESTKKYLPMNIKGKFNTQIQIMSDGLTVTFSGNLSRFNRKDNVQGLNLDGQKIVINQHLEVRGLPQFDKDARFTRIDMTQNYKTGSARKRDLYMQWIQAQNYGKLGRSTFPKNYNTTFGAGSQSRSFTIYDKALLMRKEKGSKPMIKLLDNIGALRFEMVYRTILKTRNINLWNEATQAILAQQFLEDAKPMKKRLTKVQISGLPNIVKGTYMLYINNYNIATELSPATFSRHKKILKKFDIDISSSNKITRLVPKQEIIELENFSQDELLQG